MERDLKLSIVDIAILIAKLKTGERELTSTESDLLNRLQESL